MQRAVDVDYVAVRITDDHPSLFDRLRLAWSNCMPDSQSKKQLLWLFIDEYRYLFFHSNASRCNSLYFCPAATILPSVWRFRGDCCCT